MKILITIGHPAHIHYFKNAANNLIENGYQVLFFIRDKECIVDLAKSLNIDYVCYGKGGGNMLSKLIKIPIIDLRLLKIASLFKPDIFLSFGSPYAAHVAKITGKPHIAFDDTEHAKYEHLLYRPFTDVIISPYVYNAKLHKRQKLIKTFMELFYLNDKYFTPNKHVLSELGVHENEKYCVIRFIAWNANHDVGYKGLSNDEKIRIVDSISENYKVFISSEEDLPKELELYRLKTHPSQFHSVMKYASLSISEGATTASESAVLGTPTIYVNPLNATNCNEEEIYGLLYKNIYVDEIIEKSMQILNMNNSKKIFEDRKNKLHSDMIDGTAFLTWFIENYPESKKMLEKDPDYQYKFQ